MSITEPQPSHLRSKHGQGELLRRIIRQAKRGKRTALNLSSEGVFKLPSEIGQLTNLQSLDLGNNQLTDLSPEIGQLTNLQTLDLGDNQLTGLLPEIQNLAQLEKLDLRRSPDLGIPEEILGTDWDNLGSPQTILEYYFSRFRSGDQGGE